MNEFISAFTGGAIALLGVFLNDFMTRNQKRREANESERSFIQSILCEIEVLEILMEQRHEDIIAGNFDEDGIFRFDFSIEGNYLHFFEANMQSLMIIKKESTRKLIQEFILYTKSYFDSIRSHSQILHNVYNFEFQLNANPENLFFKTYLDSTKLTLKEFDSGLYEQAKHLKSIATYLKQELQYY